jgi:hypothetical protein
MKPKRPCESVPGKRTCGHLRADAGIVGYNGSYPETTFEVGEIQICEAVILSQKHSSKGRIVLANCWPNSRKLGYFSATESLQRHDKQGQGW